MKVVFSGELGRVFYDIFCVCKKIMVIVFKKFKWNFCKKVVDEDDEIGNDNEVENVFVILKNIVENLKLKEKKKFKIKVDKVVFFNFLLSFDDEVVDEGEVFKVCKLKESCCLVKKIE